MGAGLPKRPVHAGAAAAAICGGGGQCSGGQCPGPGRPWRHPAAASAGGVWPLAASSSGGCARCPGRRSPGQGRPRRHRAVVPAAAAAAAAAAVAAVAATAARAQLPAANSGSGRQRLGGSGIAPGGGHRAAGASDRAWRHGGEGCDGCAGLTGALCAHLGAGPPRGAHGGQPREPAGAGHVWPAGRGAACRLGGSTGELRRGEG
mmetsp:Transcript_110626/g.308184  ORF Transcript_110626/g.308184 Transcript_110626/m.308184 type:complete len:205 (-) Transcript_110626:794-1408(-)